MSKDALYLAIDQAANQLRSKMDASEYKTYLLGIIFYKYLSDHSVGHVYENFKDDADFSGLDTSTPYAFYQDMFAHHEADMVDYLESTFKYALQPAHTFDAMVASIRGVSDTSFKLETFDQAMRDIEQSGDEYKGLFADVDLNSTRLGSTRPKQSQTVMNTFMALASVDLDDYSGDALGDAYEYLIRSFAMSAGQRAGEFYTPHEVSDLMARIITSQNNLDQKRGLTVYDATAGSGSLLLTMAKHNAHEKDIHYYGQELNTTTHNLARMNMILHKVPVDNYKINNGDTLDSDWPTDEPTDFDAVMMNPPYSADWSQDKGLLQDPRFSAYGKLAPKSKADYAFLLHGYYHLKKSGVMAIVLPHGVLFRGGAEGTIRQKLLEDGAIDTVIGLPGKIFYNTDIPTTVLILRKDKKNRDVLFIDASELYKKEKTQNVMQPEHIEQIVEAYKNRQDVDKLAHVATFDEIEENDFNLNIPRYVDTFEPEPVIPLSEVAEAINQTNAAINAKEAELFGLLDQLTGTNEDAKNELNTFLRDVMGGK